MFSNLAKNSWTAISRHLYFTLFKSKKKLAEVFLRIYCRPKRTLTLQEQETYSTEAEFMNVQFVEVSGYDLKSLRFPYTMFTLQTSFKPLLLGGGGGGY
jgi:hypothetical protein